MSCCTIITKLGGRRLAGGRRRPGGWRGLALTALAALILPTAVSASTLTPLASGSIESESIPVASAEKDQPCTRRESPCDRMITSFDGHQVPVTIYLSEGDLPAPTLLWMSGFGGSRSDASGDAEPRTGGGATPPRATYYAANGYNVVAIDRRGHGDARATSEYKLDFTKEIVRDTIAVIDYIAENGRRSEWALLDDENDPRLGTLGSALGANDGILAAISDEEKRIDALAPENAANDYTRILAPNGVPRSGWWVLLGGLTPAFVTVEPEFAETVAWVFAFNELPDGPPPEPDAVTAFLNDSPAAYPGRIDVPTLLIQGVGDTLTPLNEAVANRRLVADTGAEVELMTHLEGHPCALVNMCQLLPPDWSTQQCQDSVTEGAPAGCFGGRPLQIPCGHPDERILGFYNRHLKGLKVLPEASVSLALEDGTCITSDDVPHLLDRPLFEVALGEDVTLPQGAPTPVSRRYPLLENPFEDRDLVLGGIPRVRGSIDTGPSPDGATVFFSLVAEGLDGRQHVVNKQYTPLSVGPSEGPRAFDMELAGVGTALPKGHKLYLDVASFSQQFALNGERGPGLVTLSDVMIGVPVVACSAGAGSAGGRGRCRTFASDEEPSLELLPGLLER